MKRAVKIIGKFFSNAPRCRSTSHGTSLRCLMKTRYEIDGVLYCPSHAKGRALDILLDMER